MSEPTTPPVDPSDEPHHEATFWQKAAWVMYDWANSGFGLIITGPLFQPYFIGQLLPKLPEGAGAAEDRSGFVIGGTVIPASAVVALMTATTAALVALAAPVLGAIADIKGWTRRLFILHALVGGGIALGTIFLSPGQWPLAIPIYIFSAYCFGAANTFYNAFLPRLTRPQRQGSLSGLGFAAGYVGGALALIFAYFVVFQFTDNMPLALTIGGAWWLLFSLPAMFLLPSIPPAPGAEVERGRLVTSGFRRVFRTFANIRQYRMLFLFLLAFLLYANGTDTVINLSPAFGKDVLNMTAGQLVTMFLIVQFVAFGGALLFGWLADRVGNKPVIVSNLIVWVLATTLVIFVMTPGQFTALAILVGVVLGGVQASSRSLMARLAPREIHNEAFGFFSLSGKAVSVLGPLIYAGTATLLGPRYGVLAVLPFLLAGLLLLLFVREPRENAGGQT
jgi:UMF1 family MFS transporter